MRPGERTARGQPGPGGKGLSETREGVPGDGHSQAKARGRDGASKAGAKRGGGEGAEAPAGSSALPSSCLARASGGLSVPTAEPGSAFLALLFVDLWTAPRAPAGLRGGDPGRILALPRPIRGARKPRPCRLCVSLPARTAGKQHGVHARTESWGGGGELRLLSTGGVRGAPWNRGLQDNQ